MRLTSWFRGIKGKLIVSAMIPTVGFMATGIISYSGTTRLNNLLSTFQKDIVPNIQVLGELREARNKFGYKILSAISDTKLGIDPKEDIESAKHSIEEFKQALEIYKKTSFTPEEEKLWAENKDVFPQLIASMEKIHSIVATKEAAKLPEAEGLIFFEFSKIGKKAGDYTAAATKIYTHMSDTESQMAVKATSSVTFWTFFTIVSATFIALILSIWTATRISKILTSISDRLQNSSNSVTSSVGQLSHAGNSLSQSSTQAAASLEETVASLEEMTSMVQMNSDNAKQAAALSATSREAAEKGQEEIGNLMKAMTDIASSSKKIEEIISVIDDIAFQTNLLALNASVEAARAGEQGKGFAVVAEAVRALAQRSAGAAKDINVLIKDSVIKVDQGGRIASQSGTVLNNIVTSVKKVADLNTEIATASAEQTAGIQQISKAMNDLDQSSQSNAASAEEIAATSSEISGLANTSYQLTLELNAVIHGSEKQNISPQAEPVKKIEKKSDSKVLAFHIEPKKQHSPVKTKTPPSKPESQNVIPFDDDDLGERSKVGTTDGF